MQFINQFNPFLQQPLSHTHNFPIFRKGLQSKFRTGYLFPTKIWNVKETLLSCCAVDKEEVWTCLLWEQLVIETGTWGVLAPCNYRYSARTAWRSASKSLKAYNYEVVVVNQLKHWFLFVGTHRTLGSVIDLWRHRSSSIWKNHALYSYIKTEKHI